MMQGQVGAGAPGEESPQAGATEEEGVGEWGRLSGN